MVDDPSRNEHEHEHEHEQEHDSKKNMGVKEIKKDITKLAWAAISTVGLIHVLYVHPIELIKVRMQINQMDKIAFRPNTVDVAQSIYQKEGLLGFYKGISASMAKTVLYTGTRFVLYNYLIRTLTKHSEHKLSLKEKMGVGFFTGGFAAFLSTPANLAFIRMTADAGLPLIEQKHYRHVGEVIFRVVKHEGYGSLWRGASPIITRSMLINSIQLSLYSETTEFLKHNFSNLKQKSQKFYLKMYSSLISTFFLTLLIAPIDITITRIQLMNTEHLTPRLYLNSIDCMKKIIQREGFSSLWKGFTPLFVKLMPNTIIALYFVHTFDEYCYEN